MPTGYRCIDCGRPGADLHTLVCDLCLVNMPPYFRRQAELRAVDAALLRQAFMGDDVVGGIRWTEQQYRDFERRAQQPAPREAKTPKALPVEVTDHRTIAFELELLPTRNKLDRMHFRAKSKLLHRIGAAIASQIPGNVLAQTPFQRARVEIVRMSTQEPDPDALDGSAKPILDAMQRASERHPYGAGILVDDSRNHIELVTRWQRAAPKRGRVIVLVTPL